MTTTNHIHTLTHTHSNIAILLRAIAPSSADLMPRSRKMVLRSSSDMRMLEPMQKTLTIQKSTSTQAYNHLHASTHAYNHLHASTHAYKQKQAHRQNKLTNTNKHTSKKQARMHENVPGSSSICQIHKRNQTTPIPLNICDKQKM